MDEDRGEGIQGRRGGTQLRQWEGVEEGVLCLLRELSIFLTMKPMTRNQFSVTENALKFTYGNVEFKNFAGVQPPDPRQGDGEGRGGGEKERTLI